MKRVLIIFGVLLTFFLFFSAVSHDRTRPTLTSNSFGLQTDNSYITFGGTAADTITVSDTINYIINVGHYGLVSGFIQIYWDKISSGDPTVTLAFAQGNDGTNFTNVLKGKARGAYTKTLSPTADTYYYYSFNLDTVVLEARYLRLKFSTTSTGSVKAKITGKIKFNNL